MDVRAIRSDQDHQAALAEIETLWNAAEGSDEAAKLDALVTLVEHYEAARWPIEDPDRDPIDVLQYVIEEGGHSQAELSEMLGSRSRASEVLARRRALTVEMIYKISEAWKIPASLLVRPYAARRVVRRRASKRRAASMPRKRRRA
ncbi:MAG: helix-turn-helix domain-containing protein [Xanthobacteraceae bacterium]